MEVGNIYDASQVKPFKGIYVTESMFCLNRTTSAPNYVLSYVLEYYRIEVPTLSMFFSSILTVTTV